MAEDTALHGHVFLAAGHEHRERKTWAVIWLCGAMMVAEIVGGTMFGSVALVADGLHMSTHAGALLIAALAYTYARRHAADPRFTFGTGKLGDLAGFASAIILAMIALLIGYEAVTRLLAPVAIDFREAIPIAVLGLVVNLVSAWLLAGGDHAGHPHGDGHGHGHAHGHAHGHVHGHEPDEVSGPAFVGHDHRPVVPDAKAHRDNNFRAALIHVVADAAVSVLVIIGLVLARFFGWLWIDPVVGIVGALVIANWSYGLIRDTGAILLDVNADSDMSAEIRESIEGCGDRIADLHLWRLGPGHLGAILSIVTATSRTDDFYRALLSRFRALSHLTIEIRSR